MGLERPQWYLPNNHKQCLNLCTVVFVNGRAAKCRGLFWDLFLNIQYNTIRTKEQNIKFSTPTLINYSVKDESLIYTVHTV